MKHTTKNYLKLLAIVIFAVLIYYRFKKISYLEGDALPLPDVTTDPPSPDDLAVTTLPTAAVIAPLSEGTYGAPVVVTSLPSLSFGGDTQSVESAQQIEISQLKGQLAYAKSQVEALATEKEKAASVARSKTNVDRYKEAKSIFASAILNPADLRNIYGATQNDKCYQNKKATFKVTNPGITCRYKTGNPFNPYKTSTVY
jgi:hypothetical protein